MHTSPCRRQSANLFKASLLLALLGGLYDGVPSWDLTLLSEVAMEPTE